MYDTTKEYKIHRQNVIRATAKVDNKPPKLDISYYYKPLNLENDARRITEMDNENIELLKRMNKIFRLGGQVDCWAPIIKYTAKPNEQQAKNKVIMKANKELLRSIRQAASHYPASDFIRNWKYMRLKVKRGEKYALKPKKNGFPSPTVEKDLCMIKNLNILKSLKPSVRKRCFFDIEVRETKQKLGTIVFELYNDVVPRTCANFEGFCSGVNGLSYKNTPIHRIIPGYWCQGGDVTKFNGIGGTSIYGTNFENENFNLLHAAPGILSMYSNEENKNDSRFNLTFKQLESMNGRRVVFGRVVLGIENIYKIEEFGTKTGKPTRLIIVSNCGILPVSLRANEKVGRMKSKYSRTERQ